MPAGPGVISEAEGLAHQCMREGEAADRRGHLDHDPRAQGLVEQVEQAFLVERGQRLEGGQSELAPDHGGDAEYTIAVGGQAIEPPPDHVTHAFRDVQAP